MLEAMVVERRKHEQQKTVLIVSLHSFLTKCIKHMKIMKRMKGALAYPATRQP